MNKSDLIKALSKETELTRAESPDLDSVPTCKSVGHFVEYQILDFRGSCSCPLGFLAESLNEI